MIKEKALIVQLSTSHWTARKYDAKATEEVNENHNAHNAGRFNKTLIVSDLLRNVNTALGKARTYHYKITSPWDDAGQRLLPIDLYFDYTKKMEEFIADHKQQVQIFLKEYPSLQEDARNRLNTLFNEADYPDVQTLAHKFNISYKLTPIADSSDLRITLSKDEVKRIKDNIESNMSEKMNNVKNDIVGKATDAVSAMYEKLSEENSTFRDTLVGNIVSLAELIPSINFDEDEQLIDLVKKLTKLDVPPAVLRKDLKIREKTTKRAKKLLKQLKEMQYGDVEPEPIVVPKKEKVKNKRKKAKRLKRK